MKILIAINHSYMLWQMRRELIQRLLDYGEVVISTPFVGHEDDFEKMGCRCVETEFDRHGTNPLQELKLFDEYKRLIRKEKPDLVITYSIKPNIYAGFVCRLMKIPYTSLIEYGLYRMPFGLIMPFMPLSSRISAMSCAKHEPMAASVP